MPTLTIPQAFQTAIEHYRAGRWSEAEAIYRQILAVQPANAAAYANLGEVYRAVGRFDEALTCFHRAIELKPDFGEAYISLGNALRERGHLDEAIVAYERARACRPAFAEAESNLGGALRESGRLDKAIAAYRRALEFRPDLAIIWNNLASALWDRREFAEAWAAARRGIELDPNLPDGFQTLGNVLNEQGDIEGAAAAYRRSIELRPNHAEAHNNLGVALTELGQLDDAVAEFHEALRLKVPYLAAQNNLGVTLTELGHADEALTELRRALKHSIPYPAAHNNLGNALAELGRFEEADAEIARALDLDPNYAEAKFGRALLALLRGDFEHGWPWYEFRWEAWRLARREFSQPTWDGGPLEGRRILVRAEQGLGDAIQFVRYAPLIAARGGEVIVECPRDLVELLRTMDGVREIVAAGDPLPAFDRHISMLSLPLLFQTTLASIPQDVPYLSAEPERCETWTKRLGARGERLRVGLAWAGSPKHRRRRIRDLPFGSVLPLLRLENVEFHSLQWTANAGPMEPPAGVPTIIDHTTDLHDLADTAALMMELDLIISVDTAVAHLAGASGRSVWTLLPFVPDWRWGLAGETTPWYPTMRLFRQPARGDWESVIRRVIEELKSSADRHVPA